MHWVRLIFVTMFKEAPSQPLRESLRAVLWLMECHAW